jgi:hypothetical protein
MRCLGELVCGCVIALAATAVRADEWAPAKTYAVIVGVLEWEHGLQPYAKRNRKDQELRDLLVRRGTPEENIALLLDKEATLANVRDAVIKTARGAGEGSTLIVYYAGHGMPHGDGDYCFANYELNPSDIDKTGWRLADLGETLAGEFKGSRVLLCADCCYSGGLEIVVERLAKAGIDAANVTSASAANVSTNNWTFTQSLIDSLAGEPLVDVDGDGQITLGELAGEVESAMRHRERQQHGFAAKGLADDFVLAKTSGPRAKAADAKFPLGSYVVARDQGTRRVGRVVAIDGDEYTVEFYDYSDKRKTVHAAADLAVDRRRCRVAAGARRRSEARLQSRVAGNLVPREARQDRKGEILHPLHRLRRLVGRMGGRGPHSHLRERRIVAPER